MLKGKFSHADSAGSVVDLEISLATLLHDGKRAGTIIIAILSMRRPAEQAFRTDQLNSGKRVGFQPQGRLDRSA